MKRLLVLAGMLCLAATTIQAQHGTLFGRGRVLGGFGSPLLEFGLSKNLHTAIGGGGGVVIESAFIGLYGMASADFSEYFDTGQDIDRVELAHGGLWLGYTYKPQTIVHPYTSIKLGWGAVDIPVDDDSFNLDQVFVFTPDLGVEVNVFRWFRVVGTVGYRMVRGAASARGYSNRDFSGWTAGLGLRLGWFGNRQF